MSLAHCFETKKLKLTLANDHSSIQQPHFVVECLNKKTHERFPLFESKRIRLN